MNKILIPTDLSANSLKALEYGLDMASKYGGKIILLNVYFLADMNARQPILKEMNDAVIRVGENKNFPIITGEEKEDFPESDPSAVFCEMAVRQGFAEEEIMNVAIQKEVDLILMGTHGASGLRYILFGSSTAEVIEKSEHPVLAIPPEGKFEPIERVSYATDLKDEKDPAIGQLIRFIRYWGAALQMVNVRSPREEPNIDSLQGIAESISDHHDLEDVLFFEEEAENAIKGLTNHIQNQRPNILAMTTQHRYFFQKLTRASHTKKMVLEGNTPVLAFHR